MPELTEQEYDALDELYTRSPPAVNPAKSGTGFFTRRTAAAKTAAPEGLSVKAVATRAEIACGTVRERVAAGL